jgi:predicted RNase H-like HicB family nuclease
MSAVTKKKRFFIIVTHKIIKEDNMYVAICPEFNIASQGKTIEYASENLKDAVLLYLEGIEELGTREQVFKEKKIKKYSRLPRVIPEKISISGDFNNMPFVTPQLIPLAC